MFRYVENIEISVRYLIARENIDIFDMPVSTFYRLCHLAKFSARSREIFIQTFVETLTEFFIVKNFVKFYITAYLSEFQKAVISCRGTFIDQLRCTLVKT